MSPGTNGAVQQRHQFFDFAYSINGSVFTIALDNYSIGTDSWSSATHISTTSYSVDTQFDNSIERGFNDLLPHHCGLQRKQHGGNQLGGQFHGERNTNAK